MTRAMEEDAMDEIEIRSNHPTQCASSIPKADSTNEEISELRDVVGAKFIHAKARCNMTEHAANEMSSLSRPIVVRIAFSLFQKHTMHTVGCLCITKQLISQV